MKPHLAVVSLWAEDPASAAHFYRDVIGLDMLHVGQHAPHFQLGETMLVIQKGKPQPVIDPVPERFPVLALAVESLEEKLEKLRRHGIDLPWGIEGDAGARWVMFYDPGGNLVELVES
jgi:catechol-2,3-dioxygenase